MRHRQMHGLGLGVCERVGLVIDCIAVATREQAADLAHDVRITTMPCAARIVVGSGADRHSQDMKQAIAVLAVLAATATATAHADATLSASAKPTQELVSSCGAISRRCRRGLKCFWRLSRPPYSGAVDESSGPDHAQAEGEDERRFAQLCVEDGLAETCGDVLHRGDMNAHGERSERHKRHSAVMCTGSPSVGLPIGMNWKGSSYPAGTDQRNFFSIW